MESLDKYNEKDTEPEVGRFVHGFEALKLPAVEVKNEVAWVNKKIKLPFGIKKGESNRLGMFLMPSNVRQEGNFYPLEIQPEHHRSGVLGRVIFEDEDGNVYRDVDLKGVGYTYLGRVEAPIRDVSTTYQGDRTWGILDKSYAENDIKKSEQFLKAGIRTYRPVALIELEEIIDANGARISIKEAKKKKIINKDSEPVIEVRAFGVRTRVGDININNLEERERLINDAINFVASELGKDPDNFSREEYLEWFIKTVAVSLARMHNRNWVHGYLTTHNITLDARIIDLDSVETAQEIQERATLGDLDAYLFKSFYKDKNRLIDTADFLIDKLVPGFLKDMRPLFYDTYSKELKDLRTKNKKQT